MREAVAVVSGIAALVIILTLLAGGNFGIGTGSTGPWASFGYDAKGFHR